MHIHDGKIHNTARFDHALFCQKMPTDTFSVLQWQESAQLARDFLTIGKTKNIVTPDNHCYKQSILGVRKNADIVL